MSKNGRADRGVKLVVADSVVPKIPLESTTHFSEVTQARLDRAGARMQMAQQQLQAQQAQVQIAQNNFNQEFGRLRGILEVALEEAGLPLETEAQFVDGHVRLGKIPALQMTPEVPKK